MTVVDDKLKLLQSKLESFGLHPFEDVRRHDAVMTSEDQVKVLGAIPASSVLVKNLVLKDKSKAMFLVVIEHTRKVDMKVLVKQTPGASSAFRFVDDADVASTLGVEKGSVTPLAVMNDTANAVTVVISKSVAKSTSVFVHPLTNQATVRMATADLLAFIKASGNTIVIVDMDAAAPAAKPAAKAAVAASPKAPVALQFDGMSTKKTQKTFGEWYSQVVSKSEMIDYYDISGCYILRPWSYFIWEEIQNYFNVKIKAMGVKNSYFPLFVSQAALNKEKDHVEGFSAEVAWVTRAGKSELEQPIAIRPTSETVMYPLMSRWIRSYRDLPMKLNQWSNVVRWEFKHPTPFIRSREFLWQEGHTAHATSEGAGKEVREILDLYAMVYEELLACPIIKGTKTEKEKFAGAWYTTTAEAFIPCNGRGVQGATSHCLGQNFAKMFKIEYDSDCASKEKMFVWQNSWGLTTRSIGVMVMVHGDDKGLVLPPAVAPVQCIMVPIYFKSADENDAMNAAIKSAIDVLATVNVRSESDLRTIYTPGWKYNHWELKGVPLRFEMGPKDLKNKRFTVARRDTGAKLEIPIAELCTRVPELLRTIQRDMLAKAKADSDARLKQGQTWKEFMCFLNGGNRVLVPFCETEACEDGVKEKSRIESEQEEEQEPSGINSLGDDVTFEKLTGSAKSLCIPFDQPKLDANTPCFHCQAPAKSWTMFGRSY